MRKHEYIVVGAGPSGLQMSYFLEMAGRDYVCLEAKSVACSFFVDQPRWRTLISFNKKHNWFDEPDFALRYDWNSLLTHDFSFPFTPYSDDLYPHADTIVKYMGDFAAHFNLRIQYNTRVTSIIPVNNGADGFHITDESGEQYMCRILIIGTGAVKPDLPNVEGIELAEGYEEWTLDLERFHDKRVIVMGTGNSAFEVANHLAGVASTIQIFTGGRLVTLSWQTHWGGDLRSINNNILDMVHLKMPHVVTGAEVTKIEKRDDGTLLVHYSEDFPHWSVPGTMYLSGVYDHVIRATGWKYVAPDWFPEAKPQVCAKSKFAVVKPTGESVNIPNLYFIGVAGSNGERKSTYGFISGFRYMIRTAFNLMEQRYHGIPYARTTWRLESEADLCALVDHLITRISTNSSLYSMWAALADVIVVGRNDAGEKQGTLFLDMPMKFVETQPEMLGGTELITIALEFGFDKFPEGTESLRHIHLNDPAGDGLCAAFLHPVIRHWRDGALVKELHTHSGLFVRFDAKHTEFAPEFSGNAVFNKIFNTINSIVGVVEGHRTPKILVASPLGEAKFVPWGENRKRSAEGLPECIATHQPGFVADTSKYF
jgi:thioredoxin reductase